MRFKKQKRHRRAVRFYTACFGFREPYKVLCDGTFIHHLVENDIAPRDKAVSNTLGGSVKLFTTRCVLGELQALRAPYAQAFKDASSNYMIARCDHERRKSAVDCIAEIIGQNNAEHFFVGTQDADMRKKLQQIPGVPVMFGLRNSLFLEQPSVFQRQFVKSAEESRQHVMKEELELLRKRAKSISQSGEEDALTADQSTEQPVVIQNPSRKSGNIKKDKAKFKKNRAKGPNPLSCLKKKKPADTGPNTKKDDKGNGEAANNKRKRKKNRESRNVAVGSSKTD